MYEVKGFIFHKNGEEVHKYPIANIHVSSYDEAHEAMKEMKIEHYMFILKEVK